MKYAFPHAIHLMCFRHCRSNITAKLSEFGLPRDLSQQILDDLFGKKSLNVYVEGLVDAKDESTFEATLSVLENKWKKADPSVSHFVRWFRTYKLSVFVQSMLRPIRESAGLGTPPDEFTTNPSESANAVLKTKVNYKRSELPEFMQSILELVREQQHELERTAIRRGKYRFQDAYSHLKVAERKWFGMTTEQREGHMKKVAHTKVAVIMPCVQGENTAPRQGKNVEPAAVVAGCDSGASTSASATGRRKLSVDVASASKGVSVPYTTIEAIWCKVEEYLNTPTDVTSAPGCSSQSRMVKSKSGNRPHLVISDKGDNGSGHWKALGICSHSVVVAELNNSIPSFVVAFQKKKKLPNLTALVLSSVPKGRGRKGAKPPRKRSKQQPTEERVQLAVTHSSTSGGTSGHINTNQSPAVLCSSPLSASVVQQNVCVGGNISQVVSPLERTPAPPRYMWSTSNKGCSFSV